MDEEAEQMLEDCVNRQSKMNEWECGFVQSLSEQIERGGTLTVKQAEILEKIWDRIT